jgi:hypothetical protein
MRRAKDVRFRSHLPKQSKREYANQVPIMDHGPEGDWPRSKEEKRQSPKRIEIIIDFAGVEMVRVCVFGCGDPVPEKSACERSGKK